MRGVARGPAEARRVAAEPAERRRRDRPGDAATRCSVSTLARDGRRASRRRPRRWWLCFDLLIRASRSGVRKWRRWTASSSGSRCRSTPVSIASLTTCWRSTDPWACAAASSTRRGAGEART